MSQLGCVGSENKLQRQKDRPLECRRKKGKGNNVSGERGGGSVKVCSRKRKSTCWVLCPEGFYLLSLFCFVLFVLILLFFHYHLVPLYFPPLSNHHTVVHVHESFFLFAQSLYPLTSTPLAVILLSIHESVSILPVGSVCSLDSTYEWGHMVFVFLWLAYFTYHNILQVHPYCLKG